MGDVIVVFTFFPSVYSLIVSGCTPEHMHWVLIRSALEIFMDRTGFFNSHLPRCKMLELQWTTFAKVLSI
jgi:hypothetical protein